MEKPKRYIIAFTCVFEVGYFKHSWTNFKEKKVTLVNHQQAKEFATKFTSKRIADFYCRLLQKLSDRNFDLRTYKVVEIENTLPSILERDFEIIQKI